MPALSGRNGSAPNADRSCLAPCLVAGATFLFSLLLYPPLSDAAFAVWDPVVYASKAEHDSWASVSAHHPLYHILIIAMAPLLRLVGADFPAVAATQFLSAAGAAALLGMVVASAGRRRWVLGLVLAAGLGSSRLFILEATTGENVLPGCAAAVATVLAACRPSPSRLRVGSLLLLSLLLRQDNVLLVPGLVLALLQTWGPARARRPLLQAIGVTGVLTVAGYLIIWWLCASPSTGLRGWLLWGALDPESGELTSFTEPGGLDLAALPRHLAALGVGVTGLQWFSLAPHLLVGLGFLAMFPLAGCLLRGTGKVGALLLATAGILAVRLLFFLWYEPENAEWWLLPMALVATLGGQMIRGTPRTSLRLRRAGVLVLVVAISALLWAHGPFTWGLRERHLMEGARQAKALGGSSSLYFAHGPRAAMALQFHGTPATQLSLELRDALQTLEAQAARRNAPTILLLDRFVPLGIPLVARQGRGFHLDRLSKLGPCSDWTLPWEVYRLLEAIDGHGTVPPGGRLLRRLGRVEVLAWQVER